MDNNYLLGCLYCGDVMERPSQEAMERFGTDMLQCCDHQMVEIDMNEMYKVVRAMDTLKEKIEEEMLKGL